MNDDAKVGFGAVLDADAGPPGTGGLPVHFGLGILNPPGGIFGGFEVLVPVAVAVEVLVAVLVAGGLMIHGVRQRVAVAVAVEVAVEVDVGVGPGGRTVEVPVVVLGGLTVDVLVAVAVDVLGGRAVVAGGATVVVAGGGVAKPGSSVPSGGMSAGSEVSSGSPGCTPSASMVEGGAKVRIGGVSPSSVPLDAPRA